MNIALPPPADADCTARRQRAVRLLIEVMKDDPLWSWIETAEERQKRAAGLSGVRWAVRCGRMNEGEL